MWEQLVWPLAARQHRIDLLHSLAFVTPLLSKRPSVVTVYDLSFLRHPERFPALQRSYLSSQTRRSCHSARRVVTISESGRQDVHQLLGVALERIDVVRPGVDLAFIPRDRAEVDAFRRRSGRTSKYILHVGTLQPRKNLTALVKAFALLDRPEVELVFVGGKGWSFDEIFYAVQDLGLRDRVHFAGYVPDDDLPLWYNAAAVLVFPSVYEGFGLPIVQAMACGTPVVAADTSAVPEAAGEAALLFPAQDVTALAERLAFVLDDKEEQNRMRDAGLEQARRFSWRQAGLEMADVYHRVLAEK